METKQFSESTKLYVGMFLPLLMACLISLFYIDQGDVVLALNEEHTPELNLFFKFMTFFGDGFMFLFFLALSFFVSKYHSLLLLLMGSLQGIATYLLKKVVFKGTPRPIRFFEEEIVNQLQFVEGVKVHALNSFPSGHTLTAFSFGIFICFLFPRKYVAIPALILAALAGLSRIYLVQHFLEDVVFGSFLGVSIGLLSHWLLNKMLKPGYKQKVLTNPLIRLR